MPNYMETSLSQAAGALSSDMNVCNRLLNLNYNKEAGASSHLRETVLTGGTFRSLSCINQNHVGVLVCFVSKTYKKKF